MAETLPFLLFSPSPLSFFLFPLFFFSSFRRKRSVGKEQVVGMGPHIAIGVTGLGRAVFLLFFPPPPLFPFFLFPPSEVGMEDIESERRSE